MILSKSFSERTLARVADLLLNSRDLVPKIVADDSVHLHMILEDISYRSCMLVLALLRVYLLRL